MGGSEVPGVSWDREELDLLREATEVPERAVLELRARVLERVKRRRGGWLWVPAAAFGSLMIVAMAVWPEPEERLTLSMPEVPAAPAVSVSKPPPAEARRATVPRRPKGASVIQLETSDPDVIIYLVNADGGAE